MVSTSQMDTYLMALRLNSSEKEMQEGKQLSAAAAAKSFQS